MNIAIIDDDLTARQGLGLLLEAQGHTVVLFADGEAYLQRPVDQTFDCALLDLWFTAGLNGIALLRRLLAAGDPTPIIMMSVAGDLQSAFSAGELGAVSFLPKPISGLALQRVLGGIADRRPRPDAAAAMSAAGTRMQTLTPAEISVLRLLVEDKSNKEVAKALGISARTVEAHRASVIRKLGTRSKIALRELWLAASAVAARTDA